jgi:hypothetical protein
MYYIYIYIHTHTLLCYSQELHAQQGKIFLSFSQRPNGLWVPASQWFQMDMVLVAPRDKEGGSGFQQVSGSRWIWFLLHPDTKRAALGSSKSVVPDGYGSCCTQTQRGRLWVPASQWFLMDMVLVAPRHKEAGPYISQSVSIYCLSRKSGVIPPCPHTFIV